MPSWAFLPPKDRQSDLLLCQDSLYSTFNFNLQNIWVKCALLSIYSQFFMAFSLWLMGLFDNYMIPVQSTVFSQCKRTVFQTDFETPFCTFILDYISAFLNHISYNVKDWSLIFMRRCIWACSACTFVCVYICTCALVTLLIVFKH